MKKYVLLMLLAGLAVAGCSCGENETKPEPKRIDAPIIKIEDLDITRDLRTNIAEIDVPQVVVNVPTICVDIPEINIPVCDETIPLDTATQLHVFALCGEKKIDPYIIFAMIYHCC